MVPLEGMASGVPFVGTDAGYYKAFTSAGTAGRIATPDAAAATARSILTTGFDKMAQAARDTACTRFSAQAEADGIAKVYETL